MRRLAILFLALPAFAQDFDRLLQTYSADHPFMGSVLVGRGSQVLFSKGYGFANLEWRIPNDPATKFRIASITKQFTAAAILLLEERGKLTLDDPVKVHLPEAPAAWDKVTLRHLLTHTSGIPDFLDSPEFAQRQAFAVTSEQLVATFRNRPLDFEPGSEFRYSNSGYVLLSYSIEKITGETYENFIRQNLFAPIGMNDSGYDSNSSVIPHRASGYVSAAGGFENAPFFHMSIPQGAGGLYSTTEDLLKWTQALFGGKVLKPESLVKMTAPFRDNYALGFAIETAGGRKAIRHSGGIDGFDTELDYFPDDQLTIVVLSNVEADGPDSEELANDLAALVHGGAKHSGTVFSGALAGVRKGFLTVRLPDGQFVNAALSASGDLSAAAMAARFHLADQVRIDCAASKTAFDAEDAMHLHLAVKTIDLVRAATGRERIEASDKVSWRREGNLLNLRTPPPSAAAAQSAMADFGRVREVNLNRLSKMPNFVADEIVRRYRNQEAGQPLKPIDTIESETSFHSGSVSRQNLRRNSKPWKPPLTKLGVQAFMGVFFGIELAILDEHCSTRFDFAGFAIAGGKQLRAYWFRARDCVSTVNTQREQYTPARAGRILVEPARGEVLRYEAEGSGFPEKFGIDRITETESWDYVTIAAARYLVPVGATVNTTNADGSSSMWKIEYRNHRHFEAAANVNFGASK